MKRIQKFAELRKNLKQDLRNPGQIELDKEIETMTTHKNIGTINKPVVVGVTCIGISAFLAGYTFGKLGGNKHEI